jgi:uncharacterized membrane protein
VNEFLLILHVLAVAAWIGAGIYNVFLGPRFAAAGGEAAKAWTATLSAAMTKYFMPAGIATLVTGVLIVLVNDAYGWSDAFVSIGIATIVITTLIGQFVLGPAVKTALIAIAAGDFPAAAAAGRKGAQWGRIITVLLIVTVVFMVLKTGAG